jgi:hypothetical protein
MFMNGNSSIFIQTVYGFYSLETSNLFIINCRKFNLMLTNNVLWFFQTLSIFWTLNLIFTVINGFEIGGAAGATSFRGLSISGCQGDVMNDEAATIGAVIVLANYFY